MSKHDDQLGKVPTSEHRNTLLPHFHFADLMQNAPVSLTLTQNRAEKAILENGVFQWTAHFKSITSRHLTNYSSS